MTLPDEMQRLTEHLREAYEARMQAVSRLPDAEQDRRTQAGEDARDRADYVDRLRVSVASTRAAIASDMSKAHEIWDELGAFMRRARAGAQVRPPGPSGEEKLPSRRQKRLFRKR